MSASRHALQACAASSASASACMRRILLLDGVFLAVRVRQCTRPLLYELVPAHGNLLGCLLALLKRHQFPPLVAFAQTVDLDNCFPAGLEHESAVELEVFQVAVTLDHKAGRGGDGAPLHLFHELEPRRCKGGRKVHLWPEGHWDAEGLRLGAVLDVHACSPQHLRARVVHIRFPSGRALGGRARGGLLGGVLHVVLDGAEAQPPVNLRKAHLGPRGQELGVVLHHALQARGLGELLLLLVLVLGVDKLGH
mmetsp:Transcript_3686/g.10424  ORF Transcript_3686/g.10424 Transcript_3686/m.10424 type:complete len:251 (-) Transcript_3686:825-1577(-)